MLHDEQKTEEIMVSKEKQGNMSHLFILGGIGGIIFVCIILAGIGYMQVQRGSRSPLALKTAALFRLPVARVNGSSVLYTDYREDIETLKKFYDTAPSDQPKPTEEQLSAQVLSRYMVNAIITRIAKELSVSVPDEKIQEAKAKMISQFESEDAAIQELKQKYGWTMEEYIGKVVQPILLEQAVADAFQASTDQKFSQYASGEQIQGSHILFQVEEEKSKKEIKKLAEEVLKKIQTGESFEELAKQYGSDGTKELGGDLGWFGKGMMVKPFEDAMFALKDGELSKTLVETEFGFHIIKRTGTRQAKDFNAYLKDQIKAADVTMYRGAINPLENLVNEAASAPAP